MARTSPRKKTASSSRSTSASSSTSRAARSGSSKQAARARAKRSAGSHDPAPTPPSTNDIRRPGTEVWMVAQENAWHADELGLPPRRGSG